MANTPTLTWRIELTATIGGLRDLLFQLPQPMDADLKVLPSGNATRPHLVRIDFDGDAGDGQALLRQVDEAIQKSNVERD